MITGLGIVSPIGIGVSTFWRNALAGRSGVKELRCLDLARLPQDARIGGWVEDFDTSQWLGGMFGRMAGRFTQFAVAAAKMALQDSQLDLSEVPPDRVKVSVGSAMCGVVDIQEHTFSAFLRGDRVVPWTILEFPVHAATSHVTSEFGALGHTASFATGCCAGLDAVVWAADQVFRGHAQVAVAGGTDTPLSEYSVNAFYASGAIARWTGPPWAASRPFDRRRCGFVLAEGAAVVVIEEEEFARARGAPIYGKVLGFASASEGGELRTVDERGEATARAMSTALRRAELAPEDIDYISAHGNSMVNYDAAETTAIKLALGRHAWNVAVSSIKSMCGHALGAAGPMQLVTACLALRDGVIPPTINYEDPDPVCDLDYVPNSARRSRVRNVLVHAHSIGGTHIAVVLAKPS